MPRVYVKSETGQADIHGESLSYCMLHALEDELVLLGAEGHHFRLAAATRGKFIGMSPEEIAQLFENHPTTNVKSV